MKKYALNIEDRKVLVSRLMELTGLHSRYTFMPRCAYIVGSYTVEKEGTLVIEDNAAPEIIRTLLDEASSVKKAWRPRRPKPPAGRPRNQV